MVNLVKWMAYLNDDKCVCHSRVPEFTIIEIYRVSTKSLDNLKNLLILQLTLEMSEMFK